MAQGRNDQSPKFILLLTLDHSLHHSFLLIKLVLHLYHFNHTRQNNVLSCPEFDGKKLLKLKAMDQPEYVTIFQ